MMLAILLCALSASAAAIQADAPSLRHLRQRQAATAEDGTVSTTSSSGSTVTGEPIPYCSTVFQSFITEMPPIPTEALEFSEKYYESASRTASDTLSDCAWVSAIPQSLDGPFFDYFEQLIEFFNDPSTIMDQATLSRCKNIDWSRTDDAVAICEEFDEYAEALEERHDAAPDKDEDDDSSGGQICAAVVFALVASLVGGIIVW